MLPYFTPLLGATPVSRHIAGLEGQLHSEAPGNPPLRPPGSHPLPEYRHLPLQLLYVAEDTEPGE